MDSRDIDLSSWRTRALVQGSSGPDYVFLHSLGANAEIFVPMLDRLAGRAHGIALDLRGQGRSITASGPFTVATLADDVISCLDTMGVTRCTLVGVSIGGMLAQRVAAVRPSLVERLVLCDTACVFTADARTGWLQRAATAEADGMAALVDPTLDRWFPHACHVSPSVRESVRTMLLATNPTHYAATARALAAMDLRPDATRIRCPTTIAVGEHDAALPVEHSRLIQSLVPQSELTILAGLGHCPPLEAPEALAAIVAPD